MSLEVVTRGGTAMSVGHGVGAVALTVDAGAHRVAVVLDPGEAERIANLLLEQAGHARALSRS